MRSMKASNRSGGREGTRGNSHRRKPRPQSYQKQRGTDRHIATCPVTGKRSYPSKKVAKEVRRMLGGDKAPYECPSCEYWHLGDQGNLSREQHRKFHANDPTRLELLLGTPPRATA